MVKMAVHEVASHVTLLLCLGTLILAQNRSAIVQTTLGPVQGLTKLVDNRQVDVYYGIPFARPPVGHLRFKHPEPADPWSTVKDTITKPNSCLQIKDTSFDQFKGVEMWNPNTPLHEDCLYLNVWVPKGYDSHKPRATMVWIFGGGFWAGTSTLDVYDGSNLAANENVIVFSMNYRVGTLGFLYTGSASAPGNQGLMDQVMALQWIHDNVENFGGSKDTITIFGESSGAVSVGLHLLSPLSRNLYSRAIMQSGSPLCTWGVQSQSQARRRGQGISSSVGCPITPEADMINCLQNTDPQLLTDAMANITEYYFDVPLPPVVDNYFLPGYPQDLLARGEVKDTEVILGVNKDEGNFWILYYFKDEFPLDGSGQMTREDFQRVVHGLTFKGDNKTDSGIIYQYADVVVPSLRESYRDIADDISGDDLFKCPVVDFAMEYAKKHSVYMYSFEHRLSNNAWPEWTGVMHGYEIEAVFGLPEDFNYTDEDIQLSSRVTDYWTRFAQFGDPNGAGNETVWPKMTPQDLHYLKITAEGDTVEMGLRQQQCGFRRVILPLLQQDTTSEVACQTGGQAASLQTSVLLTALRVVLLIWFITKIA